MNSTLYELIKIEQRLSLAAINSKKLRPFFSSGFHVPVAKRAHLLFLRGKIVRGITTTNSFYLLNDPDIKDLSSVKN